MKRRRPATARTRAVDALRKVLEGGRLAAPLQSNTIRITGNIRQVLQNILGMTKQTRPIIGWGADEVVYAPEIAVRGLHLTEIAQFMDSV